ncbi:MAG: transcription termination/antitermination factor NusG [Thermotogaceae bacterium]|nr:transcription termination/antitermination factor NusG [Thermotogaceae bacterium]
MKKQWYVVQTLTGLEDAVKENIEKKVKSLGSHSLVGRVVVPEEVVLDATKKSMEKHIVSPEAKLHVRSGQEVKKGQLLAEEPPIRARKNGKVKDLKNYRRIVVETADRRFQKIYNVPEGARIETGIKIGALVRQGMPFTKNGEYVSEMNGRIVNVERMKKIVIENADGEEDVYYVPRETFDSSMIKKGMKVKAGDLLAEGKKYYAQSSGKVEVRDLGVRKEILIAKTKRKKLFPGYVFVEMIMNDEGYTFVRSVPGVYGFLSEGRKPVPLKPKDIRVLLRLAGIEEYETKKAEKVELDFDVGDTVKIISGPFEDFIGVVKEVDPQRQMLKVAVALLGRETPVELHISEVEKIE